MEVNSTRADKFSAIYPRILHKKKLFISGQFFRLCSSSLFLFDGHFLTFFAVRYFLKVKSMKTAQIVFEDCVALG